jgi:ribokinase
MQQPLNASAASSCVLTVSDMCVDLVITGNVRPEFKQVEKIVGDYAIELGGSANIFASQMAKLGERVGVVGYVGHDGFGELALKELQELGVDTTYVRRHRSAKTGLGVHLAEPGDRAMLTYVGTIDAIKPADLMEVSLQSCRHWHIASYFLLQSLRSVWPEWVKRCREANITISLDTNWDPDNRWDGALELLPYVDVFLPNEAEAHALTGEADAWKAARLLAAKGPLVVVKRGAKGAIAVRGEDSWEINGSECQESPLAVADTTGAGDNFDAGFLRAWLLGRSIDSALRLGHRCALSSLQCAGGIRGQLTELAGPETVHTLY